MRRVNNRVQVLHTVVLLARASQVYKALNRCNSDRTNTYQMSGMYSSLCFCSPTCISEQGLARLSCSRVTRVKTFAIETALDWGRDAYIFRIHLYTSVNLKHHA